MSPARLLLVDDRDENLIALSAILEDPERIIDTARSGAEALRLLLRQEYAVVLLDVQMPEMDGFEVARLMRARARTRDVPIIFVTAYSREEKNVFAGYDVGAVDYLFKPLVPQIVRSKVGVFVQLHQQRAEVGRMNQLLEERVRERTTELEAERARYQDLVELMPGVLYVAELPPRRGLRYVSGRVERLLGHPPKLFVDDPDAWWRTVHPDDRESVRAAATRAHAQGLLFQRQYRRITASGETVWVQDEARVVDSDGEAGPAVRGLLVDVTTQRSLREQAERSQRLESIGEVTGSLAHDFNNLLGVILGFASVAAADTESGGALARALEEIQHAAERGASMTRRLLGLAGKHDMQPKLLPLASEMGRARELLARLLPDTIEVEAETADDDAWVRADPVHLEQVLLNLGINARDAMPRGGRLLLSTRRREVATDTIVASGPLPAGDYAVIEVRDSGSGMDEATAKRIFEPFFTTKGVGKGTGLGLASCRSIVHELGGAMDLASLLGEGTTFEVLLPAQSAPEAPAQEAKTETATTEGGPARLLVVEDESAIREMLSLAMGRYGFDVESVASGPDALERLAVDSAFDAIVTDMTMPRMSGTELIHEARQKGWTMPVLVFSGRAAPEELEGMEDVAFLQKPLRPSQLARRLRELLEAYDGA